MAEDIANLIDRLREYNESTPQQGTTPKLGGGTSSFARANQPVPPRRTDAGMGAVNVFAGFMRGITSLGRGITNFAGEVLPYANQIYDNFEDGFQAKDVPEVLGAALNMTWQGLGGAAKGLAYSFMPPTEQSRRTLRNVFGGDVYEGAYELFQSKDFEAAAENLPFLAEATKDEGVGFGIPDEWIGFDVPFLGIQKGKGLEFTKAGLYSFAFDALTDPISYTPIGLGGLARGLKSGVKGAYQAGAVQKGAISAQQRGKALKPEEMGVLRDVTSPKELYPELRGYTSVDGKLQREASTNAEVAYHALDTNPLTYIGKEMARGFGSSWRAIQARAADRRISRIAMRSEENILQSAFIKSTKKTGEVPDIKTLYDEAESIVRETKEGLVERIKKLKVSKEVQEKLLDNYTKRLDDLQARTQDPDFVAKMEAKANAYKQILKDVPADSKGMRLQVEIAREAAQSIRLLKPLVSKAPTRKLDTESLNSLGDELVAAQDTGTPTGASWGSFRDTADIGPATKKAALRQIFSPIGTGAKGALTTKEIRELSGLIEGDLTRKAPRATKGKGVKGSEQARPAEVADVINEARARLESRMKAPLKDIDPSKVTDEIFEEAIGGQYRLAGERLRQLVTTEKGRLNKDYETLVNAQKGGYNPITLEAAPTYFATVSPRVAGTRSRSAQIKEFSKAGADNYPAEVVKILKDLGVTGLHRMTFDEIKIAASETLSALTYLLARVKDRVVTAEMYEARLGQLKLSNNVKLEDDSISQQLRQFEAKANELFPGATRVTKKQIDELARALDGAVNEAVEVRGKIPKESILSGANTLGDSIKLNKALQKDFDELLADNSGPIPVALNSEFLLRLYNKSRSGMADNGRFADYVDEVILEGSEIPKTVSAFDAAYGGNKAFNRWKGEGITAGLLVEVASDISSGAGKKFGKDPKFRGWANSLIKRMQQEHKAKIEKQVASEPLEDVGPNLGAFVKLTGEQAKLARRAVNALPAPIRAKLTPIPKTGDVNLDLRTAEQLAANSRVSATLGEEWPNLLTSIRRVQQQSRDTAGAPTRRRMANEAYEQILPERIDGSFVQLVAEKTNRNLAKSAVIAEALLSRFTVDADLLSRARKNAFRNERKVNLDRLQKERTALNKTLDNLDKKLQKAGVKKGEGRRLTISELRTMVVEDARQARAWESAINELLVDQLPANQTAFKGKNAAQDVIAAFKKRVEGLDLEDVARVIAAYDYKPAKDALAEGQQITIKRINGWLKGGGGAAISQAEKVAMERNAKIAISPMVLSEAEDTMYAVSMLSKKDRQAYLREYEATWLDLQSIMHANGYGWLADAATQSLGPALRLFFKDVQNFVEQIPDRFYGGGPTKVGYNLEGKKVYVKDTFEPLTQYTYFKELLNQIELYSVTTNFAEQAALKQNLMLHALRFQQTYLALRGITPAATPSIKMGAKEIYELVGNKELAKQLENMEKLPAFIGFADIIEVMPVALADSLWFSGKGSLPPSIQAEGARVLINHMSNLKAGEWFTDEGFKAVYTHMLANMTMHARKVKEGNQPNWLELNGESGLDKIEAFIRYFLSDAKNVELEAPAFKLYERHQQNMIYSSIVLEETAPSGRIIKGLRERWEALLENPLVPKEQKLEYLREASDELSKYLEVDDIRTDLGDALAASDALVSISQSLTRDDLLTARESGALSIRAAALADAKASNRKTKAADIRRARKAFHEEKKTQYLAIANARTDLMLDSYMEKVLKSDAAINEFGSSAVYDLFNDVLSEGSNANFLIRFANGVFTKLDYKYNMESVRPALGGIQRFTMRNDNMFTVSNKKILKKWAAQKGIDGNEYLTTAMNALKTVPEEQIPRMLEDLNLLIQGYGNRAQVNKISEKAAKQVAQAERRIKNIADENGNKLFRDYDDLRMNALIDAVTPMLRVFSELAAKKVDPRLLNFYLKQAGEIPRDRRVAERATPDPSEEFERLKTKTEMAPEPVEATGIVFNPALDPDDYFTAWRDMDWTENLKAVNSIHYAMMKSEEWYQIAGEITRITGARKVGPDGAVPAGFVRLKGSSELKIGDELTGKELYYFLDTENYVYPSWAVNEIQTMADYLGAPYRKGLGKLTQSEFFKRINTVQNFAKQMMTNMRPGNHLMNFMGGVLINDVAGLRNPMNYVYSLRLLNAAGISERKLGVSRKSAEYWAERHRVDVERTSGLKISTATDEDGITFVIGGGTVKVSYDDLASIVMKNGGFVPWQQSANLDLLSQMANSPNLQALKKQGAIARAWNETSEVVGSWAAHRDDFVRMALLIDTLKKGNWNSLEDGVKGALEKVNRYHPQPQEVSKFNRDVTRHLILFFTWRAKTLGALVGDLLEQPGRLVNWERAYYNYQAGQGYQPEYFGSHDPKDEPVRYFQQSNLGILVGDNQYSISIAHPMWDLMGSDGWLSTIKWDANQSYGANAASIALGTTTNVLYSSAPLVENLFVNWLAGRTANGQDLMRGGISDEEMPTLLQEAANSFGLNVLHATMAYFYPEAINKANWDRLTADDRTQELLRAWFNWSTGARASKYLTPDNKKAARSELRSLLSQLNKREAPARQSEGRTAVSELLDYLGKSSQGSLGD